MLFDQITGPWRKDYSFGRRLVAKAARGLAPLLAWARVSLSVAKCEASERWWPTWHRGRGGRRQYPGQPLARGNILIHHPPLASFLACDTCKLISSLCYLVGIIKLQNRELYSHCVRISRYGGVRGGGYYRGNEMKE